MPRSFPVQDSWYPLVSLIMFVMVFFLVTHGLMGASAPPLSAVRLDLRQYQDIPVTYIYDGDTINVSHIEKVRLLGIDTPESSENKKLLKDVVRTDQDARTIMAMGQRAAEHTRSLLKGQRVRLEFDIQRRDRYGRLLAYVYRSSDGLFINEDLIRNGFAYPMSIPPNIRYADEFRQLFHEARKARRGLWGCHHECNVKKCLETDGNVR